MLERLHLLILRLIGRRPSGLIKLTPDERDFELGSIFDFFGSYTPKQKEKEIETVSVKDQMRLSNCSFQAATVQKEIDEEVELSARYLTAKAWQLGLCKKQGYADLRAGQEVLRRFGCCEEKDCTSNSRLSFESYVNVNFSVLDQYAKLHKTKTYWKIKNIDELLKAIDENHAVTVGIPWYSGFNQTSGFKKPWIITKAMGYYVGGHALLAKGYKPDLTVVQNSYSNGWGDKGRLYIARVFLNKYIKAYGAYANLDIEYDKITAEDIIEKYDWTKTNKINVRGDRDGAIYLIYDGTKYAYRNARAFIAYNAKPYSYKDMFIVVPQKAIDGVPQKSGNGGLLSGTGGDYWEVAKLLKSPVNDSFKPE